MATSYLDSRALWPVPDPPPGKRWCRFSISVPFGVQKMEACVEDSSAWPACSLHDMCLERQPRTLNAVLSGCDVFWWTIYYYGFNVSSFACFELSSETSLCAHRPEHVRIMTPTSDKAYLQIHPNLKNLWDSICQQTLLTLILFTVEHSYLNWGKYPNKSVMQSYFKP